MFDIELAVTCVEKQALHWIKVSLKNHREHKNKAVELKAIEFVVDSDGEHDPAHGALLARTTSAAAHARSVPFITTLTRQLYASLISDGYEIVRALPLPRGQGRGNARTIPYPV